MAAVNEELGEVDAADCESRDLRFVPSSDEVVLENRLLLSYFIAVTGDEFVRRLRRLGREMGIQVEVYKAHGKGSHRTLHYGGRRTTVKHGEIRTGLLHAMCKQLGIKTQDL